MSANDRSSHHDPRSSIADDNIARLLAHAYAPETPRQQFVARVERLMHDTARERNRVLPTATKSSTMPPNRLADRHVLAAWGAASAVVLAIVVLAGPSSLKRSPDVASPDRVPAIDWPAAVIQHTGPPHLAARPRPAMHDDAATMTVGQSIDTSAHQRRRVTLPDGSVLYADANTAVALDADRRVTLTRGRIFVEVSPRAAGDNSAAATFVVHAPGRDVRALGTRFAVDAGGDDRRPRVLVAQGKVEVDGLARPLRAGQQAAFPAAGTRSGPPVVSPAGRASHLLDWTRNLMAAAEAALVPESQYSGGALVAEHNGRRARFSLRRYHVNVHVEDGFARTTIDQTYFNHLSERLEGTFYFPLPPDASISRLAMYVGGRLMEGGMVERDYGRQVFESIKYRMLDPALLEWVDGSTFKMRVFPLEGRQEKRIILSYTQRLDSLYGRTTYRFPAGHNLQKVGRWSLRVRAVGKAGQSWTCDSHALETAVDGRDLILTAEQRDETLDRDVVIRLHETGSGGLETGVARFTAVEHEGRGYTMVRYRPRLASRARRQRRDWIVLVETSGDRNPLLARAQINVVESLLSAAEHDDRFAILTVGTVTRRLKHDGAKDPAAAGDSPPLYAATPDNISAAAEALGRTHLIGALDLEKALDAACQQAEEISAAGGNPHLLHVGSGAAILGERDKARLARRVPAGVTYVGVGVGYRWSRGFMKQAAARTGGYFTRINPDEPIRWRCFDLLATLNTPRLLGVEIRGDDGARWLADRDSLAQGEELCAFVRHEPGRSPSSVTVTGLIDGRTREVTLPVDEVRGGATYLPRMWARLEIDRLLVAGASEHRAAIVALSKAMYVMSPFTSLLVLENEQMYQQYNVDRGRKDHWAIYPAPAEIDLVHEPLDSRSSPEPLVNDPTEKAPPHIEPPDRPSVKDVLNTILVRFPARVLKWPDESEGRFSGSGAVPVWQLLEESQWMERAGRRYTVGAWDEKDLGRKQALSEVMARGNYSAGIGRDVYWPHDWSGEIFVKNSALRELTESRRDTSSSRGGGLVAYWKFDVGAGVTPLKVQDRQRRLPGPLNELLGEFPLDELVPDADDGVLRNLDEVVPSLRYDRFRSTSAGDSSDRSVLDWFEPADVDYLDGENTFSLKPWIDPSQINDIHANPGFNSLGPTLRYDAFRATPGGASSALHWLQTNNSPEPGVFSIRRRDLDDSGNALFAGTTEQIGGFMARSNMSESISESSIESLARLSAMLSAAMSAPYTSASRNTQWPASAPCGARLGPLPRFSGSQDVFTDLVGYAPGLNTSWADVLAVLEEEAFGGQTGRRGEIDPRAGKLLAGARRRHWYRLTIPRPADEACQVRFDLAGRYRYHRRTADGLWEEVVCDGRTLWHLYPEIALAARRTVSRFHRRSLAALVPWLPPVTEDLARGADLRLAGERTVAVVPHAARHQEAGGDPVAHVQLHLIFSPDGRLAERRWVMMPEGKTLLRATYSAGGHVKLLDGDEKLLREYTLDVSPAAAPDLVPDTQDLVVVPMPLRTAKHVAKVNGLDLRKPETWTTESAVALLAGSCAVSDSRSAKFVADKSLFDPRRGPRKLGYYTFLISGGARWVYSFDPFRNSPAWQHQPLADFPGSPLAEYLNRIHTKQWENPKNENVAESDFLTEIADCYDQWHPPVSELKDNDDPPDPFFGNVTATEPLRSQLAQLALAHRLRSPRLAWAVASRWFDHQGDAEFHRALAGFFQRFADSPELGYVACYERGRQLLRAGDAAAARRALEELYLEMLAAGRLPEVDDDFYRAFREAGAEPAWRELMRQAVGKLLEADNPAAAVALAWQCRMHGDAGEAERILRRALAAATGDDHLPARLVALVYRLRAGQFDEADRLVTGLLAEKRLADDASLWRLAATLADERGRTARAMACAERAVELTLSAAGERIDVQKVRQLYAGLFNRYRAMAEALATLEQQPPESLVARIIRAADRWRSLETDVTEPCQQAAGLLHRWGREPLAWEYLTTPLAEKPNEAQPWLAMAAHLAARDEVDLAGRAYAEAFAAESTNAQILWDHAQLLRGHHRPQQARRLVERIATGTWQPRFQALQQQARKQLRDAR